MCEDRIVILIRSYQELGFKEALFEIMKLMNESVNGYINFNDIKHLIDNI